MADLESRKTIGVIIECAKLTPEIFQQAIDDMLKNMTEKKSKGKTTLKKLMQNGRVDSIEVTDSNIGSFATTARKYNLNYAVKRIQDENGKKQYLVCFNGKDIDTMQKAFKEYTYNQTHKKETMFNKAKVAAIEVQSQKEEIMEMLREAMGQRDRQKSHKKERKSKELSL